MEEKKIEERRAFLPYDLVKHFKRETLTDPSSLYYYYKIIGTGFYT